MTQDNGGVMKIEDKKTESLVASVLRPDPNSQSEAVRRSRTSEKVADRIEISSRRSEVERLVNRVKEVPDVRTDKVERIAEAVRRNEYRMDTRKVARNILREGILEEIS